MVTPSRPAGWRQSFWNPQSFWDPESELLVLTLACTLLAGIGVALIMMGALPRPPAAIAARAPAASPAVATAPARTAHGRAVRGSSSHRAPAEPAASAISMVRSVPVTLDIPAIDVHTSLISLGLNKDRTIALPPLRHNAPAGWYRYLASPGEPGPAVILGHVDSAKDGPAVFYRLRQLRAGDQVSVGRADGSTAVFTVRSIAKYAKNRFPTDAVYGPQPTPELHLITCGGSFDALRGHYRDNIVVYAQLTGARAAP